MRLVYLTDTHIQAGRPATRRDDFLAAVDVKLSEVVGLCRRLRVAAVIHGGDIFEKPVPEREAEEVFCRFLGELGLPFYCVAGNHDLFEQDIKSLSGTALGWMAQKGLVRLLNPGEKIYLESGGITVQLSGQHFFGGMDRCRDKTCYTVTKENCDYAVHVVHGMLLPSPFSDQVPCTLISEISGTGADVTLGAHAHLGYRAEAGGKFFLNPGALARVTALEKELVRVPQILLLDFSQSFSFNFIPLKNVRPGCEVMSFSRSKEGLREELLHG